MKSNTKWLLICIGIVVIGVALYSYQDQVGVGVAESNPVLIQRGALVKNSAGMLAESWLLEYEDASGQMQKISLVFNEKSVCANAEAVNVCELEQYESGQDVQVEGFLNNGLFNVANMVLINNS